ncbi:MAG TPA: DPP IV N-terminal domain-containing protein [Chthonomonadales bacterium]|nr:DPP IV N-terminal domain-containing protein [Chthonomonadales bacterium]
MKLQYVLTVFAALALPAVCRGQADVLALPAEKPIVGMNTPALSPDGRTICFSYLGDLWTVPSTGGVAQRLTVHDAHDAFPRWSPDGRWITFSSNRFGTYDVFIVPSTGGEPTQVTVHAANDYAFDWCRDGASILFYSIRSAEVWRIYSIDLKTRRVRTLIQEDQPLRFPVYSPDGRSVAYNRAGSTGVWWRPRYRGSANMDIYTRDLATGRVTRITDYDGMDLWPAFSADGQRIYYASDRLTPGTPNLVASPVSGGRPVLVTRHSGDAVRWPNIARDGGTAVYLYGGAMRVADLRTGQNRQVDVIVRTDAKANQLIRLALTSGATELEVSPDGKTLALAVRGDVWTMPSDRGGDARRLTSEPSNDYDIWWSPDGKRLAFLSDRHGVFNVYTLDVASRAVQRLSTGANDEGMPKWSPDGKWVAFVRSGPQGGLYVVPADASAQPRRVTESRGNNLFGVGIRSYSWSPDSRWLAFARRDQTGTSDVWVTPIEGGEPANVTHYPGGNDSPEWSSDGRHLVFSSDRDRREGGLDLYALPLQRPRQEDADAVTPQRPGAAAAPEAPGPVEVKIDFDDIENRARRITTQGAAVFQITPDGRSVVFVSASGGSADFWSVPIAGGAVARITSAGEAGGAPRFARDSNRFYALGAPGIVRSIARVGPAWQVAQIAFTARLEVDRRAELRQAFHEFWRRMNVGFYDPNMHGVDWRAVRDRYEPLLSGVGTREEFAMFLLPQMVGELNASHTEVGPAPGPPGPAQAELGITFDENHGGPGLRVSGWMPRGPNDDLGPKIRPGEFVLQVDGEDVAPTEDLWKALFDKAGKTVELLVNSRPDKEGARTVRLRPITLAALNDLAYEKRVRESRELVEKRSGGRLAYLHIRAMNQGTLRRMERELWGRARLREGLVIDVRGNGGGNTQGDKLAELARRVYGFTVPRDAEPSTQPFRHWDRPVVLLMDQDTVSAGEIFASGFQTLRLGRTFGVRTPGYVIGTYSGTLQDGTSYRIPMWGWKAPDGSNMENNGVRPDIEVENTQDDIAAHRDRMLETAVDSLLRELPRRP